MEKTSNRFIMKEYFKLPLFVISGLVKELKSLSSFKLFLGKEHLIKIIKTCYLKFPQHELLGILKILLESILNVKTVIETDYFVQLIFTLNKSHPLINYFKLIINIHHIAYIKTSFVCDLFIKENLNQLLQKDTLIRELNISTETVLQPKFKCHQSIILINCGFSSIEKLIHNYKLFHELISECCSNVELESSQDIVVGDKIKLIYSIPTKPLILSLIVTKVYSAKEELNIIFKTEEVAKSGTPYHLIEFIVKKEHMNSICAVLRHTFDMKIPETLFASLNEEKKKILMKMKQVLEMQECKK